MPRRLASVALLLTVLSLGLAAMEAGVALLAPQPLVRAYGLADPDLGTWHRPHAVFHDTLDGDYWVRTNGLGFRMDEEADPAPDRRRVMVYGDSFVFGWGVNAEESFFGRLKTALEGATPALQLLNAGAGGYSSGHVAILARRHIPALHPAAMVYFFNNNDLLENAISDQDYRVTDYEMAADGAISLTDRPPFSPWKRFLLGHTPYGWLNQHSHLFVLGKEGIKRLLAWKQGVRVEDLARPTHTVSGGQARAANRRLDEIARLSAAHLERLAALAETARLPLVVVWIPSWEEIAGQGDPVLLELMARGREALAQVAARRRFTFIDTDRLMEEAGGRPGDLAPLRLPDGHFSVAGNAWFARMVQPALAKALTEAIHHAS